MTFLLGGVTIAASATAIVSAFRRGSNAVNPARMRVRLSSVVPLAIAAVVASAALGWAIVYARTPLHARGVDGYSVLWIAPEGASYHVSVRSQELARVEFRVAVDNGPRPAIRWDVALDPGGHWERTIIPAPNARVIHATLYRRRGGKWALYRHVRAVLA
jgi:hypothetical protein